MSDDITDEATDDEDETQDCNKHPWSRANSVTCYYIPLPVRQFMIFELEWWTERAAATQDNNMNMSVLSQHCNQNCY